MALRLDIELKNIGPHVHTQMVENIKSLNMAIFAENGSGKSFISKSFKRIAERKALDVADAEKVSTLLKKSAAMISFGATEGLMSFLLRQDGGVEVNSTIRFKYNSLPEIIESNEFIFHVFNSEYVRENLESVKYRPEDSVRGFILGKINIDLSKEREELSELEKKGKDLRASITNRIVSALAELRAAGVQQNTIEYKHISFDRVSSRAKTDEQRSYEEVLSQYNSFLNMPEGIEDIHSVAEPDLPAFNQIAKEINYLLESSFELSYFEEEFKRQISSKQDFIEQGLTLSTGNKCPFCGQQYNEEAYRLIEQYTAFLKDEEAVIIKKLQKARNDIQKYIKQIVTSVQNITYQSSQYNRSRKYFPSFAKEELITFNENIDSLLENICKKLDEKKSNIREKLSVPEVDMLRDAVEKISKAIIYNNTIVIRFNIAKNNSSNERLLLRKALCNAKLNQLIELESQNLVLLSETRDAYIAQKSLIEEKESQAKIDKRELVISELRKNLDLFFGKKYQFDSEKFCISFNNTALIENTEDVLSDGEKSILAFCFYLANVHAVVERESDYDRLLFIIDDPVSSMDFNYVYNVAQSIRNISKIENMGSRVRFIILTHNMEFMSILVRNKIAKQKYVLSHGDFEDFKDHYVMPYMSNLIDIYKVAAKAVKPTHTIPNSIRHLLETLYRFEGSEGEFEDYILTHEKLRGRGSLYSLIEDQSHGGLRESVGYTEDSIIDACQGVIDFIKDNYPGQIKEIESVLGVS